MGTALLSLYLICQNLAAPGYRAVEPTYTKCIKAANTCYKNTSDAQDRITIICSEKLVKEFGE
jgi:hypothetical protein